MKRILILAGGGGHTSIALAIAQALKGSAKTSFLVPEGDELSLVLLSPFGSVEELIKGRYPKTSNLHFPFRLLFAFWRSLTLVKREYDVVVSTGSNFCIPPAIVAWVKGVPVVNIESRVAITKPSKTASLLTRFSKKTLLQWEEQAFNLKGVVTGPIFPEKRYDEKNLGYILVTGGTEGYKRLFDAVAEIDLSMVILQCGKVDPEPYRVKHPEWTVIKYSTEFEKLVAESSLVITHQGGGTIFEAVLYGKPVIIVFNPELVRTADSGDMQVLAKKVNAPFVDIADSQTLATLIAGAVHQKRLQFENGRKNAAEAIIQV
jgi:UDP-N-acetylglucosamine:LPS N-acetylglucosamine transferase